MSTTTALVIESLIMTLPFASIFMGLYLIFDNTKKTAGTIMFSAFIFCIAGFIIASIVDIATKHGMSEYIHTELHEAFWITDHDIVYEKDDVMIALEVKNLFEGEIYYIYHCYHSSEVNPITSVVETYVYDCDMFDSLAERIEESYQVSEEMREAHEALKEAKEREEQLRIEAVELAKEEALKKINCD